MKQRADINKIELSKVDTNRKQTSCTDHDLLIENNLLLKEHIDDIKKLNTIMVGEDGLDGLIGWVQTLRTQIIYILVVGSSLVGVITWLVVLHIKI